ncbi:MAG: glycosyltransferase family 4 protein [Bacteroidales bacterium]|nr:glycosyltransferase family 4 protein [Bacteroidales bacterium]
MKIAILTAGFQASSTALVASYLALGYSVDYYIQTDKRTPKEKLRSLEALELDLDTSIFWIKQIPLTHVRGIDFIKQKERLRIFCYRSAEFFDGSKTFLQKVMPPMLIYGLQILLLCRNYDYIGVIGQGSFISHLSLNLSKKKILHTHTFHEVFSHQSNELDSNVTQLVNAGVPLVVHSEYAKSRLEDLYKSKQIKVTAIPFGLFLGYSDFEKSDSIVLDRLKEKPYLLSYGFFSNYKGFDSIWKAYLILKQKMGDLPFKIVVAGSGHLEIIEEMKKYSDFIVINKWLSNDEISTLIYNSRAVLAPYHSASQSGLPQTCYVFDIPIVATRVGAFEEVIKNGENGLLINDSPEDLAQAMLTISNDKTIHSNIVGRRGLPNMFSWNVIGLQYMSMIRGLKTFEKSKL